MSMDGPGERQANPGRASLGPKAVLEAIGFQKAVATLCAAVEGAHEGGAETEHVAPGAKVQLVRLRHGGCERPGQGP